MTHMSPVVNADTPVPISNVVQIKSLICCHSGDRRTQDGSWALIPLAVLPPTLLCCHGVFAGCLCLLLTLVRQASECVVESDVTICMPPFG